MGTKEKLAQYIEQELKEVKHLLKCKPYWFKPKKTKQNTITAVYSVIMFCDTYFDDIGYSEIDNMYQKFRRDLDILIAD